MTDEQFVIAVCVTLADWRAGKMTDGAAINEIEVVVGTYRPHVLAEVEKGTYEGPKEGWNV